MITMQRETRNRLMNHIRVIYKNRNFFLHLWMLVFTCICFEGCRQDQPALKVKKMAAVLRDFHLVDAYAQHVPKAELFNHLLKNEDTLKRGYALVLARHQVTENELRSSLKWYESHPDLLDSVYQRVLSDLAIEQARMNR